jgi:SecD/SecF fusion protein
MRNHNFIFLGGNTMKRILGALLFISIWQFATLRAEEPSVLLQYEAVQSVDNNPAVDLDQLVNAINRRINPTSAENIKVRAVDKKQIEIVVVNGKPDVVQHIKDLLTLQGTLEFRILANDRDHKDIIEDAKKLGNDPKKAVVMAKDMEGKEVKKAWFVPVTVGDKEEDKTRLSSLLTNPGIFVRNVKDNGRDVPQILVVNDFFNVSGNYLTKAAIGPDWSGKRCIELKFNAEGGQRFAGLTSMHLPELNGSFTRKMGIILNDELYSAPSILTTISDRGQITGDFSEAEVNDLVTVLNAGAMPVKIHLIGKEPGKQSP